MILDIIDQWLCEMVTRQSLGSQQLLCFTPEPYIQSQELILFHQRVKGVTFTANPLPYYHFWRCTKGLTLGVSACFIGVTHHYLVLGDLNKGRKRSSNSKNTISFPSSLWALCSDRVSSKIQNDKINRTWIEWSVSLKSEHWLSLEVGSVSDVYYFFIFFLGSLKLPAYIIFIIF